MSEHKTDVSNWTPEQRELYRKRREMGLRGSIGYANIGELVNTGNGTTDFIPHGFKKPRKSKRSR